LVAFAFGLIVLSGPLGAPGAALVLALLSAPWLICGAAPAALVPLAAVPLASVGIGGAAAALGASGRTAPARALLGAAAWAWMLCASVALGFGSSLGIADRAPDGWSASTALAADHVLGPLLSSESLLGAAVFAVASVVLGWVLSARHAPVAFLGAMIWAAGVDAALSAVGDGALGGRPAGVVAAAATAVAIEFGLRRAAAGSQAAAEQRPSADAVGRRPLSRRLA
jgi:hypothetical protein